MTSKRASSRLPDGGPPIQKGKALGPELSGMRTFVKPVDDYSTEQEEPRDESIYKKDSPRSLGKVPSVQPEIDMSEWDVSFRGKDTDAVYPFTSKKYPKTKWADSVSRVVERTVLAATRQEILSGINPKILTRAGTCQVTLKRVDPTNRRWLFSVVGDSNPRTVRMHARGKGPSFKALDLDLSCSCPAWRWQGPEYHASNGQYQDPKTPLQGTASEPVVRDPDKVNFVCKHTAAVLSYIADWIVGRK